MTIQYLEEPYSVQYCPVKTGPYGQRPGQGVDGYGSKITTDHKILMPNGRSYRLYCTQYSNAGSFWVVIGGQTFHVRI